MNYKGRQKTAPACQPRTARRKSHLNWKTGKTQINNDLRSQPSLDLQHMYIQYLPHGGTRTRKRVHRAFLQCLDYDGQSASPFTSTSTSFHFALCRLAIWAVHKAPIHSIVDLKCGLTSARSLRRNFITTRRGCQIYLYWAMICVY